ncbi:MAG: arginine--tRNA ligase [Clostridiales bacterium]|nr:arginine--tRNA ligase [Clostridiales bacterium]
MINFKEVISKNIAEITNIDKKELITYIEIPPNSEMGDYAFPCFKLAKTLKKAPPMIANEIKEQYKENEYIDKIEVVGGYLNFYINKNIFVKDVMTEIFNKKEEYGSSEIGKGKTAVIEYSSPNIAKPFHIGHLRTTVIGGALYKIYKFTGYNVIGINHLGDWGIQFGKVMAGISLWKDEYNLSDDNEELINEILKIYVRFSKQEKEDETGEMNNLARKWFIKLEAGDEEAVKLWKWISEISLKEYEKTYNLLNSKFDSYNGEAFYNDKMQAVVEELKEKALLEESQGAQVVNLEKYDMPPCIVITSTGTTIYATRDLAAFMYRMKEYDFDKLVYVVGGEQQLHFKQIFKVLELMGYEEYVSKTQHVSFGLVVDKDGEKIGSRKGNSVSLEDILKQSINKVKDIMNSKNPDIENKEEIARKIGVGAIIFNDLSASRIKDEIFDWDTILNFNGETGPYVQFMYVRTRSILEKANTDISNIDNINLDLIKEEEAIEIVKLMANFEQVIINAMEKNEPSILTRYIINLAQAFSSYYAKYTIICEDKEVEKGRLLLTKQVGDVIKKGMELLGIDCPEKM